MTRWIYIARSARKRIGSLHRDVGTHLPRALHFDGTRSLGGAADSELDAFPRATNSRASTRYTIVDKDELRAVLEKVRRNNYS